eukprot:GGOE01020575.1.p1 GENE.GGOE01020575.1~~GGOE01020575.1.p1  ORF type:complete len:442 (+),score=98.06 GGOE01020575.1:85-1410(+)
MPHCPGSPTHCMGVPSYVWAYALSPVLNWYYRARATAFSLLCDDGLAALATAPEAWILGRRYAPPTEEEEEEEAEAHRTELLRALHSIPWFTYRTHFSAIPTSHYTCDSGWGCMVRTGQMLLASTLLRHCLGSAWRHDGTDTANPLYTEVMAAFCDLPSAPFSIHSICLSGQDSANLKVGRWFTPSMISHVLQRLVDGCGASLPGGSLHVYLGQHTTVYTAEVEALCRGRLGEKTCSQDRAEMKSCGATIPQGAEQDGQGNSTAVEGENWCPVLLLIPVLLGMREVNEVYYPLLLQCCQFPQFVGIVGGRARYSLYFYGCASLAHGGNLLYLDPHGDVQAAMVTVDSSSGRLHSTTVRALPLPDLDPSMAIGFYCRTHAELADFCQRTRALNAGTPTPMFAIGDRLEVGGYGDGPDEDVEQAAALSLLNRVQESLQMEVPA